MCKDVFVLFLWFCSYIDMCYNYISPRIWSEFRQQDPFSCIFILLTYKWEAIAHGHNNWTLSRLTNCSNNIAANVWEEDRHRRHLLTYIFLENYCYMPVTRSYNQRGECYCEILICFIFCFVFSQVIRHLCGGVMVVLDLLRLSSDFDP